MLVYYSTRIFANIGLSPFLSQLLAAVMNTIFAAGTYFTPGTIERFGRRKIMLWTALGCGVSIMIFTIMIGLPNPTKSTQWTAVAFVILYNLFYGYGWVGCPWLYGPEVSCNETNWYNEANPFSSADCPSSIQTYWRSCWVPRRMALFVHHGLRRRHRCRQDRLENLDLADYCVLWSYPFRVLHVPRGKIRFLLICRMFTDNFIRRQLAC